MRRRAALRFALILALAASSRAGGGGAAADDAAGPEAAEPVDPPVVTTALPLPDGTWLAPHLGLVTPPSSSGARWVVAKVGTRTVAGRTVDVYRYVPAGGATGTPYYAQADFVDPSTGEVVGGLWGRRAAWGADPLPAGGCGDR